MTLTEQVQPLVTTTLDEIQYPLGENVINIVFQWIARRHRNDYDDLCANAASGSRSINPLVGKCVKAELQATVIQSGVSVSRDDVDSLIKSYSTLSIPPIHRNR